jgi:hypothetical protein
MSRTLFALGLVALVAGALPAQSLPPITRSKESARRAVDATNSHTAAMTSDSSARQAQGTPAPRAAGDSTRPAPDARATQSAAGSAAVPRLVERPTASFEREIFNYSPGGRRDPFVSLMSNGDLRPVITDLLVAGIVYDPSGRNSVGVLRDVSTKEQYRVRVGMSLGRMRIARIDPKSITFTIEEFGFSRQETLALGDTNKERKP